MEAVSAKRVRQAAIWAQGSEQDTTLSYKSLGDWPILLPPVLPVAGEHSAAASLPVLALLSDSRPATEIHYSTNCMCCHVGGSLVTEPPFIYKPHLQQCWKKSN